MCQCCALTELPTSLTAASQVLKKYEDEFFEVVEPKLNLKTLKRKNVITEGLITAIENADRCNGLEKLYEHLQHNADVDTLREYCKMILTAGGYPKMQKLGKKMLDELPPTEGLFVHYMEWCVVLCLCCVCSMYVLAVPFVGTFMYYVTEEDLT